MATWAGHEGGTGTSGGSLSSLGADGTDDEAGNFSAFGSAGQLASGVLSALSARPSLTAGVVTVLLAAILGNWLASRFPPRSAARDLADLARNASGGKKADLTMQRVGRRLSDAVGEARSGGSPMGRATEGVQAGLSLVPLGLKLLSNPIAQYYLRRTLARQLARAFGR